jgi:hypothetical protein
VATPRTDFITEVQGQIGDDPANSDLPAATWTSIVNQSLRQFTKYHPLHKTTELIITTNDTQAELPSDFYALDYQTVMKAAFPVGAEISYRSYIFALMSVTGAASNLDSAFYGVPYPFATNTQFDVVEDGMGNHFLTFNPAAIKDWIMNFLYLGEHQLIDAAVGPPAIAAVNTVPDVKRDLLIFKAAELACKALARKLVGDKYLAPQYMEQAASWKADFDERTRFAGIGMAG